MAELGQVLQETSLHLVLDAVSHTQAEQRISQSRPTVDESPQSSGVAPPLGTSTNHRSQILLAHEERAQRDAGRAPVNGAIRFRNSSPVRQHHCVNDVQHMREDNGMLRGKVRPRRGTHTHMDTHTHTHENNITFSSLKFQVCVCVCVCVFCVGGLLAIHSMIFFAHGSCLSRHDKRSRQKILQMPRASLSFVVSFVETHIIILS